MRSATRFQEISTSAAESILIASIASQYSSILFDVASTRVQDYPLKEYCLLWLVAIIVIRLSSVRLIWQASHARWTGYEYGRAKQRIYRIP
jgi:hypothetical protein